MKACGYFSYPRRRELEILVRFEPQILCPTSLFLITSLLPPKF